MDWSLSKDKKFKVIHKRGIRSYVPTYYTEYDKDISNF